MSMDIPNRIFVLLRLIHLLFHRLKSHWVKVLEPYEQVLAAGVLHGRQEFVV